MAGGLYRDDGLIVDFRSCRIWVDDEEIQVSAIRFRILSQLIENAGRPLSAHEIMRHAWQGDDYDLGLVRWHIARLRKELGDSPPKRIVHVIGFGYRFDVGMPSPAPFPEPQLEPDTTQLVALLRKSFHRCDSIYSNMPRSAAKIRPVRCLR
jgi:DNA-binding winged helix-turn-helix (wHTH) protein